MNRKIRMVCAMALLPFAAACVHRIASEVPVVPVVPLISPSDLNPAASYLYGRFQTENAGLFGHTFMGLILDNGKKQIALGLGSGRNRPMMFTVKPGRYSIKGIICGTAQVDLQLDAQREFVVEPGKAYYLGEVRGQTNSVFVRRDLNEDVYAIGCGLVDITNTYRETTAALKERFPGVARMETVDVLNMPAEDTRAEAGSR